MELTLLKFSFRGWRHIQMMTTFTMNGCCIFYSTNKREVMSFLYLVCFSFPLKKKEYSYSLSLCSLNSIYTIDFLSLLCAEEVCSFGCISYVFNIWHPYKPLPVFFSQSWRKRIQWFEHQCDEEAARQDTFHSTERVQPRFNSMVPHHLLLCF